MDIIEVAKRIKSDNIRLYAMLKDCEISSYLNDNNEIFFDVIVPENHAAHFDFISGNKKYIEEILVSMYGYIPKVDVLYNDSDGDDPKPVVDHRQNHIDFVKYTIRLFEKKVKVIYDDVLSEQN